MKKGFALFILILFCGLVGSGIHRVKDGFSPRRIQRLEYRVAEDWGDEAEETLKQTFHYIGRGRQCFAFASEDEKFVLKIPRTDIYKTPFWARVLPVDSYRKEIEARHRMKERFILESFRISFSDLKNQTGLLAIHLGQSSSKGKKLTLFDKAGFKHKLRLEKTPFVLQYKQPILMDSFSHALQTGDREEAKKILDALLATITERASKGILNLDRRFIDNYGYDGEKAYQIDVGSFFLNPDLDPSIAYQKSLRDSIDPVQEWLAKRDPDMLNYLNKSLSKVLFPSN